MTKFYVVQDKALQVSENQRMTTTRNCRSLINAQQFLENSKRISEKLNVSFVEAEPSQLRCGLFRPFSRVQHALHSSE